MHVSLSTAAFRASRHSKFLRFRVGVDVMLFKLAPPVISSWGIESRQSISGMHDWLSRAFLPQPSFFLGGLLRI